MMINGNKIRLREKRLCDARNDYDWQSDPGLAELDATPPLVTPFPDYILDYANHLNNPSPNRYAFAVETIDGKHIGNCTCYDVDEGRGEAQLGIIIGDRNYWDKGYGTDAMTLLINYVFLHTGLKRLYLKSLDWNARAHKSFKKCGFIPYGHMTMDGYNFVVMELYRRDWEEKRERAAGSYSTN